MSTNTFLKYLNNNASTLVSDNNYQNMNTVHSNSAFEYIYPTNLNCSTIFKIHVKILLWSGYKNIPVFTSSFSSVFLLTCLALAASFFFCSRFFFASDGILMDLWEEISWFEIMDTDKKKSTMNCKESQHFFFHQCSLYYLPHLNKCLIYSRLLSLPTNLNHSKTIFFFDIFSSNALFLRYGHIFPPTGTKVSRFWKSLEPYPTLLNLIWIVADYRVLIHSRQVFE